MTFQDSTETDATNILLDQVRTRRKQPPWNTVVSSAQTQIEVNRPTYSLSKVNI